MRKRPEEREKPPRPHEVAAEMTGSRLEMRYASTHAAGVAHHRQRVGEDMSAELLSVLVALVALVSGWLLGRGSQRIANEHYHVDASALVHERSAELRAWANEAIDVLSEASYLSAFAIGREFSAQNLLRCRYRLSALIDRGRFFLPYLRGGDMDAAKPLAFRGIRHS